MEAILAPSLVAARTKIPEKEKVFHIHDHVFLGTKFGAADRLLLTNLHIGAVVNLTAGSTRVSNHFEGKGIEYLHLELMDELISNPMPAVPRACEAIVWWGQQGTRVLVHCQAGLSRSATVVIAWLMKEHGLSLSAAASLLTERRGRRPRVNPSFWCFLAGLERELRGWAPGAKPTFDFTEWLREDLDELGLKFGEAQLTKALQEEADWVNFELFYFALCGWGLSGLMKARCLAQRPNPGYTEASKAASLALETMEVHRFWPAVQVFCLQILQQLVLRHADKRLGLAIVDMGGVMKILKSMASYPDMAEMQRAGFAALAYLGACSDHITGEIVLLGGIPVVLQAMADHGAVADVQATGCAVLMVLGSSEKCRAPLVCLGAIQSALNAMWAHPAAASVQDFGCAVLAALVVDPTGWVSVRRLGGVEAVTRAMQLHPNEPAVQERAAKALRAMAADSGGYYMPIKPMAGPWVPSWLLQGRE